MGRKTREKIEFRFYELRPGETFLARLGEEWKQVYGGDVKQLHFHNLLEIGFCHEGEGSLVLGEEVRAFEKNMITVIPPNFLHNTNSANSSVAYWEYLFVDAEMFLRQRYPEKPELAAKLTGQIYKTSLTLTEEDFLITLVRRMLEECRNQKPLYMESAGGLMHCFLIELARRNGSFSREGEDAKKGNMRIAPALFYISDHYSQSLKVAEIARVCHMSETNFRRLFAQCMNMTPLDYLNLVRVRMACELLSKTDDTMEEIAEKTGFETISTFNRNFKRLLGTSPYRWKIHPDQAAERLHLYEISAYRGW